jgi:hypothetical protein
MKNKLVKSLPGSWEICPQVFEKTPKNHANCHWDFWWFWRSNNFELKFAILVPVIFWVVLYHHTMLIFFKSLYNTERDAPSCPYGSYGHAGRRTWKWKWILLLGSIGPLWALQFHVVLILINKLCSDLSCYPSSAKHLALFCSFVPFYSCTVAWPSVGAATF